MSAIETHRAIADRLSQDKTTRPMEEARAVIALGTLHALLAIDDNLHNINRALAGGQSKAQAALNLGPRQANLDGRGRMPGRP